MKSSRHKRFLTFNNKYLDLIAIEYDVSYIKNTNSYIIQHPNYGDIQYFPKSDKVQIHRDNTWIRNGLDWLLKNLRLPV